MGGSAILARVGAVSRFTFQEPELKTQTAPVQDKPISLLDVALGEITRINIFCMFRSQAVQLIHKLMVEESGDHEVLLTACHLSLAGLYQTWEWRTPSGKRIYQFKWAPPPIDQFRALRGEVAYVHVDCHLTTCQWHQVRATHEVVHEFGGENWC